MINGGYNKRLFITSPLGGVQSILISMSVCGFVCVVASLYIKENRTPLSPRRPLIESSRDFRREHGSSRA